MANANAIFNQADINHDGNLSPAEFRNLVRNSVVGNDYNNLGLASNYSSSAYEASSTGGGGLTGFGGNLAYTSAGLGGADYGRASSYESSSSAYRSSVGNIAGEAANLNIVGAAGISATDAASASFQASSQTATAQQYATDAQGNFQDPNPEVIRRPAQGGPLTYSQNIQVRFLQPPAVPPPGPLIIKEVRPPQPPAPAPLRIRQQAPPRPQPPPLILRERPPPTPRAIASQTVVRNLPAVAVPPRSVVIERLPAPPPKPRDIVIERWIPYGAMAERKTVVQRAEAVKAYAPPRNVIIQYEAPQVRVIRRFQRLGITPEDPQAYIQRYGASLFDAQTLVQQARAAGVVEDISPPAVPTTAAAEFSSGSSATTFESNNVGGFNAGAAGGSRSSFYESSAYSGAGDVTGLGGALGSSSFETSSYRSSIGGSGGSAIDAAFAAADTNNDGLLTPSEFRNAVY